MVTVLRIMLAVVTVVACLYVGFGALDTWMFERKWKQYGNDPALIPQLDAAVRGWIINAAVVYSVAFLGWSAYFLLRRRRGTR